MEILLRNARPEDAEQAVPLIAETMAGYGVMTLGLGSAELEMRALLHWFVRADNRFSFESCRLAIVNEEVAGLLLVLRGDKLDSLERSLASGVFSLYSPLQLVKVIWRALVLGHSDEADENEFIVAHLAVTQKYQRCGIATLLLNQAVESAKQEGFSRLVLEVEIGNTPAETLYTKFGFNLLKTTEFGRHAAKLQCPGYYKLLKFV
ncbi:MAG: GNAT family N-acetyltransferase [Anaerolineaceae bacterium]